MWPRIVLICCLGLLLGACHSERQERPAGGAARQTGEMLPGTGQARPPAAERSKYTLFAEFSASQGDILLRGDSIQVYSLSLPEGAPYVPQLQPEQWPPGQEAPIYQRSTYLWEKNKFTEIRRDSLRYVPHGEYRIDQDNTVDLPVGNPGILNALRRRNLNRILIKQHAQADLDRDGTLEDILVFSRPEAGEFGYYYGIIIIGQVAGEPAVFYRYISRFESYVGRLVIRDVTRDGQPGLMLYEMDYAASGYTLYAQVFGLNAGREFYTYGDDTP